MSECTIEYSILRTIEEKEAIRGSFQDFFAQVFERALSDATWEHQFLHSPYEDTALFLATDNGVIVGAALQIRQKYREGDSIHDYYLYTTSAILKEYRPKGIYARLLSMQKEYSVAQGAAFIFAFPNQLAYPVLKLFGGFKDIQRFHLVRTSFANIRLDVASSDGLSLDKDLIAWRFEHKDYRFSKLAKQVVVYKYYGDAIDILAIYPQAFFDGFEVSYDDIDGESVVVAPDFYVLDQSIVEPVDKLNATFFPLVDAPFIQKIRVNLLMSDVF